MISRRALIGTGAGLAVLAGAGVVGDREHKLDDLARAVGLEPRPEPSAADEALIMVARRDQTKLLAAMQAASTTYPSLTRTLDPLAANARKQLTSLGGAVPNIHSATPPTDPRAALDSVIAIHALAEKNRSHEAIEAVSGAFAQVLASIAASLAQSIVVLQDARRALR